MIAKRADHGHFRRSPNQAPACPGGHQTCYIVTSSHTLARPDHAGWADAPHPVLACRCRRWTGTGCFVWRHASWPMLQFFACLLLLPFSVHLSSSASPIYRLPSISFSRSLSSSRSFVVASFDPQAQTQCVLLIESKHVTVMAHEGK